MPAVSQPVQGPFGTAFDQPVPITTKQDNVKLNAESSTQPPPEQAADPFSAFDTIGGDANTAPLSDPANEAGGVVTGPTGFDAFNSLGGPSPQAAMPSMPTPSPQASLPSPPFPGQQQPPLRGPMPPGQFRPPPNMPPQQQFHQMPGGFNGNFVSQQNMGGFPPTTNMMQQHQGQDAQFSQQPKPDVGQVVDPFASLNVGSDMGMKKSAPPKMQQPPMVSSELVNLLVLINAFCSFQQPVQAAPIPQQNGNKAMPDVGNPFDMF